MAPTHVTLAQLEVEGCTAELYLNDAPIVRLTPRQIPIANVAVEEWLIPGDNRLEVVVEPGSHPTVARSEMRRRPFRAMQATARLLRVPDGEPGLPLHADVLGEITYAWRQPPPDERDFPASLVTSVAMGPAHGRWGWQDAPVLSQGAELTTEASHLLEHLADAIAQGDADRLWALLEHKRRDVLTAYPARAEGEMRRELETLLAFAHEGPDPVVARDPDAYDFRLAAGGRMLQLVDRDWRASLGIRQHERGTRQPFRIMAARVGGALHVVR